MSLPDGLTVSPGLLDYLPPFLLAKLSCASSSLHKLATDEHIWRRHSLELNHGYLPPYLVVQLGDAKGAGWWL